MASNPKRKCEDCKESRFLVHFYVNKGTVDKKCKRCRLKANKAWRIANPEIVKESKRNWHQNNYKTKIKPRARQIYLRERHNTTQEEIERRIQRQGNACALCGRPFDGRTIDVCIDHDHETEEICGILHRKCNTAIGQLDDDPAMLYLAWQYVRRTRVH